MADVEDALEFFLERGLVDEFSASPVERVTRGSLEAALAYSGISRTHEARPSDRVEGFLEAVRVRPFGLRERLEPVRDFGEPFFARLLRHARVHVAVLVRFASDGGLEIRLRLADRKSRRRI